jgi:hypothetical protein
MIDFNPFNKPFCQIQIEDLSRLLQVEEGWYVEYKRGVPDPSPIAKTISSFANQYGGWVFFGIDQKKEGPRVAGGFPGISSKDVQMLCEKIRGSVTGNINPIPYYELRIFEGPCSEIGLGNEQCIIMVLIPPGVDPPYIHSSGRVFLRQSDSSDPKPETDRAVLDRLWERKQHSRARFSEFLEKIPLLSEVENEKPILHVYLFSDPRQDRGHFLDSTFQRYTELMQGAKLEDGGIPFDNFFTMPGGFVARQVATNDPYFLQLTWRHFEDNSVILSLPLNAGKPSSDFKFDLLNRYRLAKDFIQKISCGKVSSYSRVVDLNIVVLALTGAIQRYRRLSNEGGIQGPFYFKAFLQNVWRCVPFVDTASFQTFLDMYGIPIIQESSIFTPPGTEPESLIVLHEQDEYIQDPKDKGMAPFLTAIPAIKSVFEAFGIPPSMIMGVPDPIVDLYKASTRAIGQQKSHQ